MKIDINKFFIYNDSRFSRVSCSIIKKINTFIDKNQFRFTSSIRDNHRSNNFYKRFSLFDKARPYLFQFIFKFIYT